MHCQLVLLWPGFLRKTCVCGACSPPHLSLAIFPFLFSQEVTSDPLSQTTCIWQELGFDISTLLCSYKFGGVGRDDWAQGVCARRVTRLQPQPRPKHWEMPAWGRAWISFCTVADRWSQESIENRVCQSCCSDPRTKDTSKAQRFPSGCNMGMQASIATCGKTGCISLGTKPRVGGCSYNIQNYCFLCFIFCSTPESCLTNSTGWLWNAYRKAVISFLGLLL